METSRNINNNKNSSSNSNNNHTNIRIIVIMTLTLLIETDRGHMNPDTHGAQRSSWRPLGPSKGQKRQSTELKSCKHFSSCTFWHLPCDPGMEKNVLWRQGNGTNWKGFKTLTLLRGVGFEQRLLTSLGHALQDAPTTFVTISGCCQFTNCL